jgi:hypothetical protein
MNGEDRESGPRTIIEAPARVRLLGAAMMVMSLFGFFVLPATGDPSAWVIGPLWGAAVLYYGLHVVRLAVLADHKGLVVRNRFRSYRVPWTDMTQVEFVEEPLSGLARLSFLSDRWAGRLTLRTGPGPYLHASETFRAFPYGTLFTQPKERAREKTARVAAEWRRQIGA